MYSDNTITEIKNTLEGINSRISAAEEWISELQDKMLEITSEEQNKVERIKKKKKLRIVLETSGKKYQGHQNSNYLGPIRWKKERVWENFWRNYSWKFPQNGKGNS